ncbi:MAG: hypothetical protein AAFN13_13900, partial [Bacteroidota bacterium]
MLLSLVFAMLAAASPPDSLAAMHGVWVNDSTTVIETPLPEDTGGGVLAQTIYYRYLVVSSPSAPSPTRRGSGSGSSARERRRPRHR